MTKYPYMKEELPMSKLQIKQKQLHHRMVRKFYLKKKKTYSSFDKLISIASTDSEGRWCNWLASDNGN